MTPIARSLSGIAVSALILGLSIAPFALADAASNRYVQQNLVSDGAVAADTVDPNLVNPWGIVFNPNGPVWIANNGSGTSTLYDGLGAPFPSGSPLVVTIAPAAGGTTGVPTGIVFNSSGDFVVTKGAASAASLFVFATEDGTIQGWSFSVDRGHAIVAVDNSSRGAVYKGLALAGNGIAHYLYATDFHNGKIDVFDKDFKPATPLGSFTDPNIPAGFAPFGIQNINGDLYVTYAQQDANRHDDVAGPGLGYIDVYDANGNLIRRLVSRGMLNAPWGLALAPAGFGKFGNDLLVGNFGDGTIQAYDLDNGGFRGELRGADHLALKISGLWGLAFGNGVLHQPSDVLFFTAGIGGEAHGLYGRIEPLP